MYRLFVVALAALLLTGDARADDKREQAAAPLLQAREASDLRAPGSPPFHLRARVKLLNLNGADLEGVYDLYWSAPDRFRERVSLSDGFAELRVARDGQLWVQRTISYLPLRVAQLKSLLDVTARLKRQIWQKPREVREHNKSGVLIPCYEAWDVVWIEKACLDPVGGALIFFGAVAAGRRERREYVEFRTVGTHAYPGHLQLSQDDVPLVEAVVEELSLAHPPPGFFNPPAETSGRRWCPDLKDAELLRNSFATRDFFSGRFYHMGPSALTLYALVGIDGRPRDVGIAYPYRADIDKPIVQTFARNARFRPATCGGKPVEQEVILEMKVFTLSNGQLLF